MACWIPGGVGLVVLDLGLPDMDGLEVLAAARQGREVPVVVLTVRSQVEDRIDGLRRDSVGGWTGAYLTAALPVHADPDRLHHAVTDLLTNAARCCSR